MTKIDLFHRYRIAVLVINQEYLDQTLVPLERIELPSEGYKSTVIPLYYGGENSVG